MFGQVLAGLYRYDQLNRLRQMRTRAGLDDATNDWTTLPTPTGPDAEKYRSSYTYDANGNIRTADRWDQAGAPYDALAYGYKEATGAKLLRNCLYQVDDLADPTNALVNAGPGEQAVDLAYTGPSGFNPQDQSIETAYNYRYDELGNLTHDAEAHIDAIAWTVAGKVRAVDHAAGQGPDLALAYGAGGQRISKQVGGTVGDPGTYREHYIRDAQGNVMATYRLHPNGAFRVQERPIYGSSRVGLYAGKVDLYPATQLVPMPQVIPVFDALLRYELTDHLGHVGTVVTGRLLPGDGAPHEAEVISAQGVEPFGSLLPGRNYSSDSYRFGFQGQEKDDEMHGSTGTSINYKYRMHDARLGRFMSLDPLASKYPHNSPYAFSENRVIDGVEWEGLEVVLIGKNSSVGAIISFNAEAGIAVGPNGVFAYGATAIGLQSNVSVAQQVSITVYPTMPLVEYAAGGGWNGGVSASATPAAGWTGSINAAYSETGEGYWGLNMTLGWGASALQVSGSVYRTYTGLSPLTNSQENLSLLIEGKEHVDSYLSALQNEAIALKGNKTLSEDDKSRLKDLSSSIESYKDISSQLGKAIEKMETKLDEEDD